MPHQSENRGTADTAHGASNVLLGSESIEANPTTLVAQGHLVRLAERIRFRIKQTTKDIIETGRDLIKAKKMLEHGSFSAWIDAEFGWSQRTAVNYMAAATFAEDKTETVADLAPATIYLLAAKSTPQPIVDQSLADLREGRPLQHHVLLQQIQIARKDHKKTQARREARNRRPSEKARPANAERISRQEAEYAETLPKIIAALRTLDATTMKEVLQAARDFPFILNAAALSILDEVRT